MSAPGDAPAPAGSGFEDVLIDDPLADAGSGHKISGSSLLIVTVIVIAAGGLFAIKKLADVTAAVVVDSEIEETITRFLDEADDQPGDQVLRKEDQSTLAVLNEVYTERQVPLAEVQRNPAVIDVLRDLTERFDEPGLRLDVGDRHACAVLGEPSRDTGSTTEAAEAHDRDALSVRIDDHRDSLPPRARCAQLTGLGGGASGDPLGWAKLVRRPPDDTV